MRARRTVRADVQTEGGLPYDQVIVRMTTVDRARDGHILRPSGALLENFAANPVVLWQHDVAEPIGTASSIQPDADGISARITFAPQGVSATADRIRGLVKAGVVRGVSIGFDILDGEPIDPARPRGGLDVSKWELLECSFVSIPSDTGAMVTARDLHARAEADWTVGADRNLPIEAGDPEWDGEAAAQSIFAWAGGDEFDPAKARDGFLVYDAAAPKLRGSYKLPFARAVDGKLQVPKAAIRAAAGRLPITDIPDDVRKRAQAVIDHYKEKAGMASGDDGGRGVAPLRRRMLTGRRSHGLRGLQDVGQLAWLLDMLGYVHACSEWEEEVEDDGSKVPEMLGEALQQLGAALIAMTAEEVSELLADKGGDGDDMADDEMDADDRAWVRAGGSRRVRALRRGIARARARTRSAAMVGDMARMHRAYDMSKRAGEHLEAHHRAYGRATKALDAALDAHAGAMAQHEKLGDALTAAQAEPAKADHHIDAAMRAHRGMTRNLDAVSENADTLTNAHEDANTAARAAHRCVRSCHRAVGAMIDGADTDPEALDADSETIQTSSGTEDSEGSESGRSRAARLRRLILAELEATAA